ncbi:MAG: N-6 DNA methylase [Prevotella sp.]|nr:N-6 DNA methylase [Prevotella sp.]
MQYENTFKAIDQILWKESGCSSELDYLEQKSWLLFLKYLDDLESEREDEAELEGKQYKRIITGFNRWSQWAAPKTADGKIDVINAMTGNDLVEFVDNKLFPFLKSLKATAASTNSLEFKIGEIFDELHNKIKSGFNLREVINMIDELHFESADDKHEMTVLYENNIQRMGNAGRNGGEYYTPRPLIRSIVKVVDPKIGETVYDPACGSAGFLCEAFNYMEEKIGSTTDNDILQHSTFYGIEKKPLPYIIATMNMIFHGVSAPNIIKANTLAINLTQIQEKDRKNVILANPPFGGNERGEVLQNFEIRSSETAYMFMQHFVKMLKANGRAGIVIKNTFLSNGDAAAIRKMLLETCNLHTVLDLPSGVFTGAGVKTVVLFFTKGMPTEKVWYYQIDKHFTKTNPMTEKDLEEFLTLQKTKAESEHSWLLDVSTLGDDYDLSVKNPNKVEEVDERTPSEILDSIFELESDNMDIINALQEALGKEEEEE